MVLHIVKNKTTDMLALPGDSVAAVCSGVWGHQGWSSEQIRGHIKNPVLFSLPFPLCLLHLKVSFSLMAKWFQASPLHIEGERYMASAILSEKREDLPSFLDAISRLPFMSHWGLLITPRPEMQIPPTQTIVALR